MLPFLSEWFLYLVVLGSLLVWGLVLGAKSKPVRKLKERVPFKDSYRKYRGIN